MSQTITGWPTGWMAVSRGPGATTTWVVTLHCRVHDRTIPVESGVHQWDLRAADYCEECVAERALRALR